MSGRAFSESRLRAFLGNSLVKKERSYMFAERQEDNLRCLRRYDEFAD
jgi:hypothetical protein